MKNKNEKVCFVCLLRFVLQIVWLNWIKYENDIYIYIYKSDSFHSKRNCQTTLISFLVYSRLKHLIFLFLLYFILLSFSKNISYLYDFGTITKILSTCECMRAVCVCVLYKRTCSMTLAAVQLIRIRVHECLCMYMCITWYMMVCTRFLTNRLKIKIKSKQSGIRTTHRNETIKMLIKWSKLPNQIK